MDSTELRTHTLSGQRFHRLLVLGDDGTRKSGDIALLCQCDCGNRTHVYSWQLKAGKVKSCGCLNEEMRRQHAKDLTGYENDNFVVLEKIGSRNKRIDWLCRCKHCNGTTELNSNEINKTKSCGCLKKGASKEYMASILDKNSLKSTKPTAKSSTGVRGVYFNQRRGTYQAFINVNKKSVYLGSSKDFDKVVSLRREAEKKYGYRDPKTK